MTLKAKEVKEVDPTMGIELEAYIPESVFAMVHSSNARQAAAMYKAATTAKKEYEDKASGYPKGVIWGQDGGIGDLGNGNSNGMPELRFPPAKYSKIMESKEEVTRLLKCMSNNYLEAQNDRSGMHIHVQRDHLTKDEFLKIVKFFKNNTLFLAKFSGRSEQRQQQYVIRPMLDYTYSVDNTNFADTSTSWECIRLNVPSGVPTIEFRMFNGTLDPEKFLSNIQFVERIINFVKNHELDDMTDTTFVEYVLSSGTAYEHLLNDLKRLDLLDGNWQQEQQEKLKKELAYFSA